MNLLPMRGEFGERELIDDDDDGVLGEVYCGAEFAATLGDTFGAEFGIIRDLCDLFEIVILLGIEMGVVVWVTFGVVVEIAVEVVAEVVAEVVVGVAEPRFSRL